MACHGLEKRVVGPPWREIQKLYKDNPSGIVAWAKAPGKKRSDYPQMPPMALPDEDLKIIAEYVLKL
jgi:cytochrome c